MICTVSMIRAHTKSEKEKQKQNKTKQKQTNKKIPFLFSLPCFNAQKDQRQC